MCAFATPISNSKPKKQKKKANEERKYGKSKCDITCHITFMLTQAKAQVHDAYSHSFFILYLHYLLT